MVKASSTNKIIQLADIHETAVIENGAKIAKDVKIGAYSIIGENVEIKKGTKIGPHVQVEGWTTIGKNNQIFHGAVIGSVPPEYQSDGEKGYVFIGDNNIIREHVTIFRGTDSGGGETRVGNENYLMAYCNIAQNCQLGNSITMINATNLGEHVIIEDQAVIGGLTGVDPHVRIGKIAMIGAHSSVEKDVPPYILVDGHPARVNGINVIGLRRNGFKPELRSEVKRIYKLLYRSRLDLDEAIEKMDQELDAREELEHFLRFLRNVQRGICR